MNKHTKEPKREKCHNCDGEGERLIDGYYFVECKRCHGKGFIEPEAKSSRREIEKATPEPVEGQWCGTCAKDHCEFAPAFRVEKGWCSAWKPAPQTAPQTINSNHVTGIDFIARPAPKEPEKRPKDPYNQAMVIVALRNHIDALEQKVKDLGNELAQCNFDRLHALDKVKDLEAELKKKDELLLEANGLLGEWLLKEASK